MNYSTIKPASSIKGQICLPGDKSITHRAIILSAISHGKTIIKNFSFNKDCLCTVNVLRNLGVRVSMDKSRVVVSGRGLKLQKPPGPISVEDSGTTLRVLLGVLAGQEFFVTLRAGKSLTQRPMRRVIEPLRLMGARISAECKTQGGKTEEYAPITIQGGKLKPITYKLSVASAQVKSAILLAGLYAKGDTEVIEPIKTRDHTERMLKLFGADLRVKGHKIIINGRQKLLSPSIINIPGDISSASFFIVAAAILPDSCLRIKSVSLNPGRIGIIKVLKRMGVNINPKSPVCPAGRQAAGRQAAGRQIPMVRQGSPLALSEVEVPNSKSGEPIGDLEIKSSKLKGTIVRKEEIPSLIDELPILMVAACYARGDTLIESVRELRVKETDRVNSMVQGLSKMGARIRVNHYNNKEDIIISGIKQFQGARVSSFGDHRTAMSLVIAALTAKGNTFIDDLGCIDKSFPNFEDTLNSVIH